jgi:hypothetical protein
MRQKIVKVKIDKPDPSLISRALAYILDRSVARIEADILKTRRIRTH